MIYTIFLYQSHTGLLIYDKSFQEINAGKMEMFSSFFLTLKSFVSELVVDGSKELKNVELGEYTVLITSLSKVKVDMVIIADKEDTKAINKLIPKLIKLLQKHEQLFLSWDGSSEEFKILDHPLTELVSANVIDVKKTLLKSPEQILKSIWGRKRKLTEEKFENLVQERDLLIYKIENTVNIPSKLTMAQTAVELSEELQDESTFLKYQGEVSRFKNELKDAKFKLNYYLNKIKTSVNEAVDNLGDNPIHLGDFKNSYLNLYSFSTKLKLVKENGWEVYREIASKLIDKDSLSDHELSEIIQTLLNMSTTVEDHLN
jgi:mannitol/fructose-specific phosphotransferase system IIA component (Ntr-type)